MCSWNFSSSCAQELTEQGYEEENHKKVAALIHNKKIVHSRMFQGSSFIQLYKE